MAAFIFAAFGMFLHQLAHQLCQNCAKHNRVLAALRVVRFSVELISVFKFILLKLACWKVNQKKTGS